MNWLSIPTGLILAAVVIPPLVLLYFLKLRRRSQPIACTLLWKRSIEDLRANAPFQRIRRSILLLLQLLALLLLALSVMQPQVQAGQRRGGKTVLLIDNSASMTATDGGNGLTRLQEAKRRAKERIEALYGGGVFSGSAGETMVIAFSDRVEVTSAFTSSKATLLGAIDRILPTHGQTRIEEALKLARAYTTNVNPDQQGRPVGEPATLELYSDGRIADQTDQVIRGETLNYHPIGTETGNVAIANISVERPYGRPTAVEVFAAIVNFTRAEITTDVQLSVNGVVRSIESLSIGAAEVNPGTGELIGGRSNVVFTPFDQPRGAVIEVAILREDDLPADNVARLVVPPPKQLRVALVAPGRFLVRSVLEGMSLRELVAMTPDEFDKQAEEGGLDRYDVIVLMDHAPEILGPGRYLTFGPTPPLEGLNEFGDGKQQVILATRDEHPALRFVVLDNLFILKFKLLQPAADVQVLAEGSAGPAIVAVSRGPLQVIHVTFDPLDSNWPFHRSFVTFVFNAVEYLGHAGAALTSKSLVPGEAITARLPASATKITMTTPDGAAHDVEPVDPTFLGWGPIRLSGAHVLSWSQPEADERQSRIFAVNLLGETEGRIEVKPAIEMGKDTWVGEAAGDSTYTPLWPWAIGLCLAVMMVEWWIYHRKAYV